MKKRSTDQPKIRPGSPEWYRRRAALTEAEQREPIRRWILVFEDDTKFLGAIFVNARGIMTAIQRTWDMAINPGGQVAAQPIPDEATLPPGITDRLLSEEELNDVFKDYTAGGH